MERRAIPRKPVLMSGVINFAGSTINCLIRNMTISGNKIGTFQTYPNALTISGDRGEADIARTNVRN